MRFLLDQDVYFTTARFLRDSGHDVVSAAEIGCSQAGDEELLIIAQEQGRIFVTRDRDFGGLVFVRDIETGVIYLRILPSTLRVGHKELETVLTSYSEEVLRKAFVPTFRRSSRRFLVNFSHTPTAHGDRPSVERQEARGLASGDL